MKTNSAFSVTLKFAGDKVTPSILTVQLPAEAYNTDFGIVTLQNPVPVVPSTSKVMLFALGSKLKPVTVELVTIGTYSVTPP